MPRVVRFHELGARSLEDRRRGFDAALQRRSRFDGAGDWLESCEIHVHASALPARHTIPDQPYSSPDLGDESAHNMRRRTL